MTFEDLKLHRNITEVLKEENYVAPHQFNNKLSQLF